MNPPVIGLMGPAGAGKNFVGNILYVHFDYATKAFADPLRSEVYTALACKTLPADAPWQALESGSIICNVKRNLPSVEFEFRGEFPSAPVQRQLWLHRLIHDKPTHPAIRRLLQWWGTEYRRTQDESYWIKKALKSNVKNTVFTDVRFLNEALMILALGGIIIEIEGRRDAAVPGHASEKVHEVGKTIWSMSELGVGAIYTLTNSEGTTTMDIISQLRGMGIKSPEDL